MGKKIVLFCILVFVLSLWSMGTVLGSSDPGQAASVNVRDYGARGNGVTDDARAIQAAIDDASTRGIPTVAIPAGHYMVSVEPTAVHLRSNITVQMQSGAVIEAIPTDRRHYNVFHVSECRNVVIQGGTLVGERNRHLGSGGEWGMGIRISDSSNVTVRDITIKDFWGDGIYIGGSGGGYSRNILIKNADISNNRRQGISMTTGVDGVIIEDCTIHNINGTNPQAGIDIETNNRSIPARNIIIRNNTFFDNVNTDVLIATEAENVEIYGNKMIPGTIRNTPRGVALDFADNITIRDNKIYDRGHGVQIRDSKNITVENNLIQGRYQDSVGIIFYHNVNNVRVLRNHIKDIDCGINIAPVSNIHIEGNTIENTRQYGINSWNNTTFGAPRNVTYKDNVIRKIGSFAILARNNGALITGNRISDVAGAYIEVRTGTNVKIEGNRFHDYGQTTYPHFILVGSGNTGIEISRNRFESTREAKYAVTVYRFRNREVTITHNTALYSTNPFRVPGGHTVADNIYKGADTFWGLRLASGL